MGSTPKGNIPQEWVLVDIGFTSPWNAAIMPRFLLIDHEKSELEFRGFDKPKAEPKTFQIEGNKMIINGGPEFSITDFSESSLILTTDEREFTYLPFQDVELPIETDQIQSILLGESWILDSLSLEFSDVPERDSNPKLFGLKVEKDGKLFSYGTYSVLKYKTSVFLLLAIDALYTKQFFQFKSVEDQKVAMTPLSALYSDRVTVLTKETINK